MEAAAVSLILLTLTLSNLKGDARACLRHN